MVDNGLLINIHWIRKGNAVDHERRNGEDVGFAQDAGVGGSVRVGELVIEVLQQLGHVPSMSVKALLSDKEIERLQVGR